jgi:hypothetical protein
MTPISRGHTHACTHANRRADGRMTAIRQKLSATAQRRRLPVVSVFMCCINQTTASVHSCPVSSHAHGNNRLQFRTQICASSTINLSPAAPVSNVAHTHAVLQSYGGAQSTNFTRSLGARSRTDTLILLRAARGGRLTIISKTGK